jgi:transcription elongation GreA/GreB family factor
MDGLKNAMKEAQDAANEETKSSSGDKYETTRALNQLDKDMFARQLLENTRELAAIIETDCEKASFIIGPGSFVQCNTGNFFLIAGLGKISFDGESIYVISPNAPLAKSMQGKRKGDFFLFNNNTVMIESVT